MQAPWWRCNGDIKETIYHWIACTLWKTSFPTNTRS